MKKFNDEELIVFDRLHCPNFSAEQNEKMKKKADLNTKILDIQEKLKAKFADEYAADPLVQEHNKLVDEYKLITIDPNLSALLENLRSKS